MTDQQSTRKSLVWNAAVVALMILTIGTLSQPGELAGVAEPDQVARKFIYPPEFKAGLPYTRGVLVDKTLYISGQIDKDPRTGTQPGGIAEQTRMAMTNMGHVLRAAGMDDGNVVTCQVQLADMGQFVEMTKVYGSLVPPDSYPARTTLHFPGLPGGANVEVSCIAYADRPKIVGVVPPPDAIPTAVGPYSVYKELFPLGLAPSRASYCIAKRPGTISVEMTYIATRDESHSGRVISAYNRQNQTSSRGGVLDGNTLYTSGRSAPGKTMEEQMRASLETIRDILKLAGMNMEHIVDPHMYLKDMGQMDNMNAVFKENFPTNPPVRTTVQAYMNNLVQVQAPAVR